MLCNKCIKQDVCKYKAAMEETEDVMADDRLKFIELDCRHREPATGAQLEKMRRFFNNTQ